MDLDAIHLGNCLDLLPAVPAQSVDLILCDLPYGVSDNVWDSVIPIEPLFKEYRRILAPRGALILTGQGLFSAKLMLSAPDLYRYSLVWKKNRPTGHLNSRKMPMRAHEDVLVFYDKLPVYHPQRTLSKYRNRGKMIPGNPSKNWGPQHNRKAAAWVDDGYRMPTSIVEIDCPPCPKSLHPTGKPVELGEWLIKTYSDPGALVLDNACGSGSFLLAAKNTGRRYLGMELDAGYVETARKRLL